MRTVLLLLACAASASAAPRIVWKMNAAKAEREARAKQLG
jgi:hypothetical protein